MNNPTRKINGEKEEESTVLCFLVGTERATIEC